MAPSPAVCKRRACCKHGRGLGILHQMSSSTPNMKNTRLHPGETARCLKEAGGVTSTNQNNYNSEGEVSIECAPPLTRPLILISPTLLEENGQIHLGLHGSLRLLVPGGGWQRVPLVLDSNITPGSTFIHNGGNLQDRIRVQEWCMTSRQGQIDIERERCAVQAKEGVPARVCQTLQLMRYEVMLLTRAGPSRSGLKDLQLRQPQAVGAGIHARAKQNKLAAGLALAVVLHHLDVPPPQRRQTHPNPWTNGKKGTHFCAHNPPLLLHQVQTSQTSSKAPGRT